MPFLYASLWNIYKNGRSAIFVVFLCGYRQFWQKIAILRMRQNHIYYVSNKSLSSLDILLVFSRSISAFIARFAAMALFSAASPMAYNDSEPIQEKKDPNTADRIPTRNRFSPCAIIAIPPMMLPMIPIQQTTLASVFTLLPTFSNIL